MSTTLLAARTALRRRLEDSSGTPLWSDDLLNDALTAALNEYSQWSREQKTTTFTAADSDTSATLPTDCREVLRVIDAAKRIYPRAASGAGATSDVLASWEAFAGALQFTKGLSAGTYTVWYEADWTFPSTDATAFGIPDSDIDLLLAMAAVVALDERAVQEWKRGQLPSRYQTALTEARNTVNRQWSARRRRLRVGSVASGGGW